jgi:hypothetical protein
MAAYGIYPPYPLRTIGFMHSDQRNVEFVSVLR